MSSSDHPVNAWKRGSLGGTVLRSKDGSLYFIRDEMLEALRVEGEGLERLEEAFKTAEEEAHQFQPSREAEQIAPAAQVGYIRGSLLRKDTRNVSGDLPDPKVVAASTVMCPWFC